MKNHSFGIGILAMALLLPVAACSQSDSSSASNGVGQAMKEVQEQTSPSVISAEIQKGIDQAKRELATQDIDIDHVHVGHGHHDDSDDHDNLPKAVITPKGDLVIAGKTIPASPELHALLLDYRQQIINIASAGMDIGARGADLGTQAAKEAIFGALTGKSDKEIEARIKPQTEGIKTAALKLCQRMPDMLASQQKLAAAMPEFRPYANMTQKDIDDCGKDIDKDD